MNDTAPPEFYTFVLCGGSGERLWPIDLEQLPAQFIPRSDDRSLFQNTLLRLRKAGVLSDAMVICQEAHRYVVGDQLQQVGVTDTRLLLEPCPRNTMAAVAAAALLAVRYGDDPVMLVAPANRLIGKDERLCEAFAEAHEAALRGSLVAFGTQPGAPLTRHGYIKTEATLQTGRRDSALRVVGFVDRPSAQRAQKLAAQGDHLWNTGMFCFKASVILAELRQKAPRLLEQTRRAVRFGNETRDLFRLDLSTYHSCSSHSIDEMLMEHAELTLVIPLGTPASDTTAAASLDQSPAACVHD